MLPKDTDGIANSEETNQTTPVQLIIIWEFEGSILRSSKFLHQFTVTGEMMSTVQQKKKGAYLVIIQR